MSAPNHTDTGETGGDEKAKEMHNLVSSLMTPEQIAERKKTALTSLGSYKPTSCSDVRYRGKSGSRLMVGLTSAYSRGC